MTLFWTRDLVVVTGRLQGAGAGLAEVDYVDDLFSFGRLVMLRIRTSCLTCFDLG